MTKKILGKSRGRNASGVIASREGKSDTKLRSGRYQGAVIYSYRGKDSGKVYRDTLVRRLPRLPRSVVEQIGKAVLSPDVKQEKSHLKPDIDVVVVMTGPKEGSVGEDILMAFRNQLAEWLREKRVTRSSEPQVSVIDGVRVVDVELYVPRADWLEDRHREIRRALRRLQTDSLTFIPSIVPELNDCAR